jgi:hypothetical protein
MVGVAPAEVTVALRTRNSPTNKKQPTKLQGAHSASH